MGSREARGLGVTAAVKTALRVLGAVIAALTASLVILGVGPWSEGASACSVGADFIPPTNYELVAKAEAIVVAKATSEQAGGRASLGSVRFEVVEVIKGKLAKGLEVESGGTLNPGFYKGRSAPGDFSKARPGTYVGSCRALDYRKDAHYLLFLGTYEGVWRVSGPAFTRINEEVEIKGEPWVEAVRRYVKVSALPDLKSRRAALEGLRAKALTGGEAGGVPEAMAADIDVHMRTATPFKSFAELEVLWIRESEREARARIVLAMGLGGDPAASKFMGELASELLRSFEGEEGVAIGGEGSDEGREIMTLIGPRAVAGYYEARPDPGMMGELTRLYVAMGSSRKQQRWPLMWTLIHHAGAADGEGMLEVLGSADEEEVGRLAAWFALHPEPSATARLKALVRGDLTAHSEVALALGAMGDVETLEAAKALLAEDPSTDGRWVGAYVIARSPLPEADEMAGALIKAQSEDLPSLVDGYAEATHRNVGRRLREIQRIAGGKRLLLDALLRTQAARARAAR